MRQNIVVNHSFTVILPNHRFQFYDFILTIIILIAFYHYLDLRFETLGCVA